MYITFIYDIHIGEEYRVFSYVIPTGSYEEGPEGKVL